jgi:hypothetical protein
MTKSVSDDGGRVVVSERVEMSPSGPTRISEWRKSDESSAFKVLVSGARAGDQIIRGMRLIRYSDGRWALVFGDTKECEIFSSGANIPYDSNCCDQKGARWSVTVVRVTEPIEQRGLAVESEWRLDLRILRSAD